MDMIIQATGKSCTREQIIETELEIVNVRFSCILLLGVGVGVAFADRHSSRLGTLLYPQAGQRV